MNKLQCMEFLRRRLKELEKTRDSLRKRQNDLEDILNIADEASDELSMCIDKLSEII